MHTNISKHVFLVSFLNVGEKLCGTKVLTSLTQESSYRKENLSKLFTNISQFLMILVSQ